MSSYNTAILETVELPIFPFTKLSFHSDDTVETDEHFHRYSKSYFAFFSPIKIPSADSARHFAAIIKEHISSSIFCLVARHITFFLPVIPFCLSISPLGPPTPPLIVATAVKTPCNYWHAFQQERTVLHHHHASLTSHTQASFCIPSFFPHSS